MNPAQFVGQYSPEGLFRPGNYSQVNYNANFDPSNFASLVQDAMQKQAAFEAAYQARQNNMGWEIADQIQSTLDKGAITAEKFERIRTQAIQNRLNEKYGERQALADLEGKEADTERKQFDLAMDREFKQRDMRSLLDQRDASIESTKAGTESTKEATRAKRAEFPFVARAQEAMIGAQEAATRASQDQSEVAARTREAEVIKEIQRRDAFSILNKENQTVDDLYQRAMAGDIKAFERLENYNVPYGLEEHLPQQLKQFTDKVQELKKLATGSQTRLLSETSRNSYERLAQKLYTDSPAGRPIAAKIIEILRSKPGFLGFEQEQQIQDAFNVYKTKINPSTKLALPVIEDNYSFAPREEREARREKAQEADRRNRFSEPKNFKDVSSLLSAASRIISAPPGFDVTEQAKNEATALLMSLTQDPELRLVDPEIRSRVMFLADQIRLKQESTAGGKKPTQDAQRANQQNFDTYGAP